MLILKIFRGCRWPQLLVLKLEVVGAYVYASLEIRPGRMSINLSLSFVRRLRYAAKRNDISLCCLYVFLLDVLILVDSRKYVLYGA